MRLRLLGILLVILCGAGCLDVDLDNDGLTDEEEQALGTDPEDADTDDDGLEDGVDLGAALKPTPTDQPPLYSETEANTIWRSSP